MKKLLVLPLLLLSIPSFAVDPYTTIITQYDETGYQTQKRVDKPLSDAVLSYNGTTNVISWGLMSGLSMTSSQLSDATAIGKSVMLAADQAALKTVVGVPTAVSQLTNDSAFITSGALTGYATTSAMTTGLAGKFTTPTGTASQYVRGDGSVATLPMGSSVQYSGATNGSGIYSVTYGSAYGTKPKLTFSVEGGTNKDSAILTSSTTGFSVLVERRTDVLGLLPSYAVVNGLTVNVTVNP